MLDDARWGDDPRDRDDNSRDLSRGSRGGSDPRDRERVDPRDVFMEHVNLPRGLEREHVHYHGHDYTLRGSETRTLTTVGAFRAVPASDLRDSFDQPLDPRHGELWHLRDSGLVQTVRLDRDHTVVTLTRDGRDLLESRRPDDDSRDRQAFYAGVHYHGHDYTLRGVPKTRELKHDAELYRAYTEEADAAHVGPPFARPGLQCQSCINRSMDCIVRPFIENDGCGGSLMTIPSRVSTATRSCRIAWTKSIIGPICAWSIALAFAIRNIHTVRQNAPFPRSVPIASPAPPGPLRPMRQRRGVPHDASRGFWKAASVAAGLDS